MTLRQLQYRNLCKTTAVVIMTILIACSMLSGNQAFAQKPDIQPGKPKSVPAQGVFYTHDWSQWNLFKRSGNGDGTPQLHAAWRAIIGLDPARQNLRLIYPVPGDPSQAYLFDYTDGDCRTEGQGYGLMMAVEMNDAATFAKLWKFAKMHLQYSGRPPQNYYFHWRIGINPDKTLKPMNFYDGSAPDGDIWIAAALLNAAGRWNNPNYRIEANRILRTFLHTTDINAAAHQSDPNWNNNFTADGLVCFGCDGYSRTFTDPSYNLPAFFEYFAHYADQDRPFWHKAANRSRRLIADATGDTDPRAPNHASGTQTAYTTFSGKPFDRKYDPGTGIQYGGDAWRTISNIGVDYMWWGDRSKPEFQFHTRWTNRFLNYLASTTPPSAKRWAFPGGDLSSADAWNLGGKRAWYPGGLNSDGSLIGNPGHPWLSHFIVSTGMNAAGALPATTPNSYYYIDEIAKTDISECAQQGPGYFNEVLYTLGLLETTGHFRFFPVKNPK